MPCYPNIQADSTKCNHTIKILIYYQIQGKTPGPPLARLAGEDLGSHSPGPVPTNLPLLLELQDRHAPTYNNYQSGDANPWTDVNWLDVGGAALVGGLIGFGLGPMIPAVGAMIGGTVSTGSIGAGLAAGGGAFAAASGWLDGAVSTPEATPEEQSYAQSRVYTSPDEDPANPSAQTARNAARIPDPTKEVGQQKTVGAYSILEDQNGNVVGGGQSGPVTINTTYGNPDRPVTPYGINCAEPDCFVNADNAGTLQSNTRYNLYTYKQKNLTGAPCNNCDVSIQRFADTWQSMVRAWFNTPDGGVDYRDYNPQP